MRGILLLLCAPALLRADTATELWVRTQVFSGHTADLTSRSDRVLSSAFLFNLLNEKNGIDPRSGIIIVGGIVRENLDLKRLDATFDVALDGFEFDKTVDLWRARFHRGLWLENDTFKGTVSAYGLAVDENLYLIESVSESALSFDSIRVAGKLFVYGCVFQNVASFVDASLYDLDVSHTKFNDRQNSAIFNSSKVTRLASFGDGTEFSGNANFGHFQASNFQSTNVWFSGRDRTALFDSMRITDKLTMEKGAFSGWVSLAGMTADTISLTNVGWPGPDRTACDNMKYRVFAFNRGMETYWPAVCGYSPSVYSSIASALAGDGRPGDASRVRVDAQWRGASGSNFAYKLVNRLFWLVAGYGERPWRAFAGIALFVVIGSLVFLEKAGMVSTNPDKPDPGYNPFWYSLGLFLPVVDIGLASSWRPKPERRYAPHYAHVHVLLGWLLVPIALASVSGFLR